MQGSIPEMQKSLDSRVYFDQNGVLCQRLGIDQVPARVSAVPGDRFLKVEFIPAEEGRNEAKPVAADVIPSRRSCPCGICGFCL